MVIRSLLLAALLYPLVAQADFLFSIRCDYRVPANNCVVGDITSSRAVWLLAPDGKSSCQAAATGTVKLVDSYGEPYIATTLAITSCPRADYDLVFVGAKRLNYKPHILLETHDIPTVERIHKRAAQNDLYTEVKSYLQERLPNRPTLYSVPSPQGGVYLAHYPIMDFAARSGPLLFVTKNAVMEVDSEARIVRAMEIDGHLYVVIEHTCWAGCGNVYRSLIRFDSERFYEVASYGDGT